MAERRPDRVVIGVIDNGFAFAHARFRNAAGTRIEYLWRQDFMGGKSPWTPGVELTKADINPAVMARGVDEDSIYRRIGGLDYGKGGFKPLGLRRSHGTHVLDLAAGADPDDNIVDRPIIAVDMPDEAVGDPAASTLTVHAALGLIYILDQANSLRQKDVGETLPVVVNLSYGPSEGPHDGTSLLELVMDALVPLAKAQKTPLKIVLAAGNFRQSRLHAELCIDKSATQSLTWRLQPGALTPSLMEIWLPKGRKNLKSVTLRAPNGDSVAVTPADPFEESKDVNGNVLVQAQLLTVGANGILVVLSVARTAIDPAGDWGQAVAPSGRWMVDILNDRKARLELDAWIKRSDTPSGHRAKGRQSYFEEKANDDRHHKNGRPNEFDGKGQNVVRRHKTLSGIATGDSTIVIGGYRRGDRESDLHPAPYTSAGPHHSPTRGGRSPDWLEVSDDSIACRGALAAGTRSGSWVPMNGTSAAAPQAARWIAAEWLRTGAPPGRPADLVQPKPKPGNPIPPEDRDDVIGHGLHPNQDRQRRTSS
jgi:hypothetical protein